MLPRELVTVMRTYLDWQLKESNDGIPMSITNKAEVAHGRALMLYYDNMDSMSGKEMMDLFRNGYTQAVKR